MTASLMCRLNMRPAAETQGLQETASAPVTCAQLCSASLLLQLQDGGLLCYAHPIVLAAVRSLRPLPEPLTLPVPAKDSYLSPLLLWYGEEGTYSVVATALGLDDGNISFVKYARPHIMHSASVAGLWRQGSKRLKDALLYLATGNKEGLREECRHLLRDSKKPWHQAVRTNCNTATRSMWLRKWSGRSWRSGDTACADVPCWARSW